MTDQTNLEVFVAQQNWSEEGHYTYRCSVCHSAFDLSHTEARVYAAKTGNKSTFDFGHSAPCGHGWKRLQLLNATTT